MIIEINNFNGGVSDDVRQNTTNKFSISRHFDIFTNPNSLTPYRSSEADTHDGSSATGMKQYRIKNFLLGSDGRLYGLGKQASLSKPKIFYKTDPTSGNWTLPATAEGSGALIYDSFIEWGTTKSLWMFSGTVDVSKWVINSTFTNSVSTVATAITTVAQSLIAKDNNMYMFYNNIVVRVSPAGGVSDAQLTLPVNGRITSACMFGNYMAIAWVTGTSSTGSGISRIYLWDLVSPDVAESILWSEDSMSLIIGNINGVIVGVSDSFLSSSFGVGGGSIFIKIWGGGAISTIKELKATALVSAGKFIKTVQVVKDRLYFGMSIPFRGNAEVSGLWVVSKNYNGEYVTTIDRIEEADTAAIEGFFIIGNYVFIAHSADGSITKTDDQVSFTETSIYESLINPSMPPEHRTVKKQLKSVQVSYDPLPAAGQVVLKYKADGGSYTTIFTETTDNKMATESGYIASGSPFAVGREYQFKIESTGGAIITGLKYRYNVIPTLL